jgi:hypothetical protein
MTKIFSFANILIVGLIAFIVFKQCSSEDKEIKTIDVDGKKYELLKHKIDTFVVNHYKTQYVKGKDIYHETIVEKEKNVEVPVYIKADSERIIKEYHTKVLYKDKLVLDNGLGTIEISDTISMNKIIGRKWNAQVRERTITDTKIVKELPKNQVYIGAQGVVGNNIVMVGPQITLKTKKDNLYGVNLFLDANGNKYLGASIGWKIRLKK